MENEEYKAFLKYIFNEYIQPRINRIGRWDPHEMDQWSYEWRRLKRAVDLVNYINNHCKDTDDIYNTFTLERLGRAVEDVEYGVRWHNRLAEKAGFLDAFDSYYDEIVDGLEAELFPENEYDLFRELGSQNPKSDIQGIIYILKVRRKKNSSSNKEVLISNRLEITVTILSEAQKQFKEQNEKNPKKPKSRRWFKGLGQIGQGAALSIGDIALAAGILQFPVSTETQWSSLVSAATGVGMILNGVGELRGE